MSDDVMQAEADRVRERVFTSIAIERENTRLRAEIARHEHTIMAYADEITRLNAENARYRAALTEIVTYDIYEPGSTSIEDNEWLQARARDALAGMESAS